MVKQILKKVIYIPQKIYWDIFSPWGILASFLVFPIAGFLRKKKLFGMNEPYDIIEQFKNKHLGEKCFVVATGPSLKTDDLEKIKGFYSFSVNTIFEVYKKVEWRPTYYVMLDPLLQRRLDKDGTYNYDCFAIENSFLCSLNKKRSKGEKNVYLNINFLDHVYRYGISSRFKYTDDLLYGFYDNYSVTQDSIVLAIYMGFKTIYLLGADNDYLGSKQHFDNNTNHGQLYNKLAVKAQKANDMGYDFVSKIAKSHGVRVVNLTRGGKVEVFERDTLENVIE